MYVQGFHPLFHESDLSPLLRWSEYSILGMEPKFMPIGPKIDEIGDCARIVYITTYCFSRCLDFQTQPTRQFDSNAFAFLQNPFILSYRKVQLFYTNALVQFKRHHSKVTPLIKPTWLRTVHLPAPARPDPSASRESTYEESIGSRALRQDSSRRGYILSLS